MQIINKKTSLPWFMTFNECFKLYAKKWGNDYDAVYVVLAMCLNYIIASLWSYLMELSSQHKHCSVLLESILCDFRTQSEGWSASLSFFIFTDRWRPDKHGQIEFNYLYFS